MHTLIIQDESLIAMTLEGILRDSGFTTFDFASSSVSMKGLKPIPGPLRLETLRLHPTRIRHRI